MLELKRRKKNEKEERKDEETETFLEEKWPMGFNVHMVNEERAFLSFTPYVSWLINPFALN